MPQPVNAPRSGTGVREYFHIQLSLTGGEPAASGSPVAVECNMSEFNETAKQNLERLRNAGIKIWMNSIWPSLNAGHDDDRAVELFQPDESWGWILNQGTTIIQSDRCKELLRYLDMRKMR